MISNRTSQNNRIRNIIAGFAAAAVTGMFALTGSAQASYQAFDASVEDPNSVVTVETNGPVAMQNLPADPHDAEIVMGIRSTVIETSSLVIAGSFQGDESDAPEPVKTLAYQGDETDEVRQVTAFAYHGDESDDVRPAAGLAYHGDENDDIRPSLALAYQGDETDDVRNPVIVGSYQGDENDSSVA